MRLSCCTTIAMSSTLSSSSLCTTSSPHTDSLTTAVTKTTKIKNQIKSQEVYKNQQRNTIRFLHMHISSNSPFAKHQRTTKQRPFEQFDRACMCLNAVSVISMRRNVFFVLWWLVRLMWPACSTCATLQVDSHKTELTRQSS